jgi:hypothetical protein
LKETGSEIDSGRHRFAPPFRIAKGRQKLGQFTTIGGAGIGQRLEEQCRRDSTRPPR